MSCVHLKKLYELCEKEELKVAAPDLVKFVCTQCGDQEVCPSLLMDDYDAIHGASETTNETSADKSPTA